MLIQLQMCYLGLWSLALDLIKSYLVECDQYEDYEDSTYVLCKINYGVPNGSDLGQLLVIF